MNTRESKKLVYKLASGAPNEQTLQEALAEALWKYTKPSSRVEPLNGGHSNEVRFVNVRRQHKGMLIGLFHKLTRGASQLIIKMSESDSLDAWEVVPVTAKAKAEDANEFVQGTLFFGVWKNHVILHQSNACRADQFQDHATWLLNKMLVAEDDVPVTAPLICLADPVPPDLRRRSATQAKKVRFGSSLESGLAPASPAGAEPSGTSGTVVKTKAFFTPRGPVWDALKMILLSHNAKLSEVVLDDSIQDDIQVYLELRTPKRKAEASAGAVLGALGRALSHSDVNYEVELADGSKYGPKEMKVEKIVRVECSDRQPVVERMFASMVEWMAELVDSKRVIEQEPFGNLK